MKQLFAFAVAAMLTAGASAQVPLFSQSDSFGEAVNASELTVSGENFTLQVSGTAGTQIVFKSVDKKYEYTPVSTGNVRFVAYKGIVYVYEGAEYKGTVAGSDIAVAYTDITSENVDDAANLLADPNFDDKGDGITGTRFKFGTAWESNVTPGEWGIRIDYTNSTYRLVWRGSGNNNYIGQALTSLKPNTSYQVKLQQVASGNANANFIIGIGSQAGTYDIASTTVRLGTTQDGVKTVSLATTSDITLGDTYHFTFKNTSNNTASSGSDPVSQIDWISLVEGTADNVGLTGANSPVYASGVSYAPVGSFQGSKENPADATLFIKNPHCTSTADWDGARTNSNQQFTEAPDNTYFDAWNATYNMRQTLTDLPAGNYVLKVATRGHKDLTTANIYVSQDGSNLNSVNIHKDGNTDGDLGNGWGWTEVPFTIYPSGTITIGFYSECGGSKWAGADEFSLAYYPIESSQLKDLLKSHIDAAALIDYTSNVGTAVFQKPSSAADAFKKAWNETAQAVYDNAGATTEEIEQAISDLAAAVAAWNNVELNAPDAEKRYAVTMHDAGQTWDGNAITFLAGEREGEGNYNVKYAALANVNLAQALKFTAVPEKPNTFYISVVNANGTEQYLTSRTLAYGDGNVNDQIRTTDDAMKAVEITVKAANDVEGFKLFNQTGTEIARNSSNPDNGLYPNGNVGSYFTIAETTKPSISFNTTAAGWGTVMLPFAQALPTDVKAYTCAEVDETTLTLVEVGALEANKPYIIEGEWEATNLTGDAQGKALTVTEGLLTGVYADTTVPVGSYVLLNEEKGVGFYKVVADKQPTATANRAYLTLPAAVEVKEFFALGGGATSIRNIVKIQQGQTIYNLAGQRMNNVRKGVNIIGGKKVVIK